MKFGANSFIWESPFCNDTFGLVDRVARLGFDLLEVAIEEPEQIDATALRRRLDDHGLSAAACGFLKPDQDLSSEDAAVRSRGLAHLQRCVDVAAAIGASSLNGPFYCAVGCTGFRSPADRQAQWARAAEAIGQAAERAAAVGVRFALEPLNRYETDVLNTVEQALHFLEMVGRDDVGLLLDTYHMNIEEQNTAAALRKAGDRLFVFHACGRGRGAPGADEINWPSIVQTLSDIGFAGPAIIEAFNPDNPRMAATFPLWRRVASSQDALAAEGFQFLRGAFGGRDRV